MVLCLIERKCTKKNPVLELGSMSKKLYCGNLSYSVGTPQLEDMFAAYVSVVSAQVIMDRDTGRSKALIH